MTYWLHFRKLKNAKKISHDRQTFLRLNFYNLIFHHIVHLTSNHFVFIFREKLKHTLTPTKKNLDEIVLFPRFDSEIFIFSNKNS